jgi:hypothetical protein
MPIRCGKLPLRSPKAGSALVAFNPVESIRWGAGTGNRMAKSNAKLAHTVSKLATYNFDTSKYLTLSSATKSDGSSKSSVRTGEGRKSKQKK